VLSRVLKVTAFAASMLACAHAHAQGVTSTTVVIGQSAPLTGANADLGNDIRNGALAYLAGVNAAGGVHGRKIELTTLDDGNQVPRAEANTKKLVEETGVFALFGYASATLSRPALPTVEKHGVPFLAPFTGADPRRVYNKNVYNMRGSYAEELEKIVDHFVPLGIKRFAIVYYDDAVGRENFTAVERALKARNLQVVSTASFKDRAKPDIAAGMKEIAKGMPTSSSSRPCTRLPRTSSGSRKAPAWARRWRATRSPGRARSPRSSARTARA
jgi:branched-chain amino acid transport system substrate-binding protein